MKKLIFNVKEKSIVEFFAKSALQIEGDNRRNNFADNPNPYYFMKDEIFLKKMEELKDHSQVIFELFDESIGSRKKLVNTYIYDIEQYDDISIKLKLIDFKIDPVKLN